MFFIELMASRFDIFGQQAQDLEASDPAQDLIRQNEKFHDTQVSQQKGKRRFFPFLVSIRRSYNACQSLLSWLTLKQTLPNRRGNTATPTSMVLTKLLRKEILLLSLPIRILWKGGPEARLLEQFQGEQMTSHIHLVARTT